MGSLQIRYERLDHFQTTRSPSCVYDEFENAGRTIAAEKRTIARVHERLETPQHDSRHRKQISMLVARMSLWIWIHSRLFRPHARPLHSRDRNAQRKQSKSNGPMSVAGLSEAIHQTTQNDRTHANAHWRAICGVRQLWLSIQFVCQILRSFQATIGYE